MGTGMKNEPDNSLQRNSMQQYASFKGAAWFYFKDDNEAYKSDEIEIPFTAKNEILKKTITKCAKCYKPKNEA